MRPFTVLIGILLGSAASIAFGWFTVLIVSFILRAEHPDLARELPQQLVTFAAFLALTAASAGSFLGQIKLRPWRGWAHLATLAILCSVVALYWPKRI